MSRRSFLAAGAQTTRLASGVIFTMELVDQLVDVQLLAHPGIKLANADVDRRTKRVEPLDSLQQLASELFLGPLPAGPRPW